MKSSTVLSDVLICPATLWREDSVPQESGATRPRRRNALAQKKTRRSDYSHVCRRALQPPTGTSER